MTATCLIQELIVFCSRPSNGPVWDGYEHGVHRPTGRQLAGEQQRLLREEAIMKTGSKVMMEHWDGRWCTNSRSTSLLLRLTPLVFFNVVSHWLEIGLKVKKKKSHILEAVRTILSASDIFCQHWKLSAEPQRQDVHKGTGRALCNVENKKNV